MRKDSNSAVVVLDGLLVAPVGSLVTSVRVDPVPQQWFQMVQQFEEADGIKEHRHVESNCYGAEEGKFAQTQIIIARPMFQ